MSPLHWAFNAVALFLVLVLWWGLVKLAVAGFLPEWPLGVAMAAVVCGVLRVYVWAVKRWPS
jgi:hypothetical protein